MGRHDDPRFDSTLLLPKCFLAVIAIEAFSEQVPVSAEIRFDRIGFMKLISRRIHLILRVISADRHNDRLAFAARGLVQGVSLNR